MLPLRTNRTDDGPGRPRAETFLMYAEATTPDHKYLLLGERDMPALRENKRTRADRTVIDEVYRLKNEELLSNVKIADKFGVNNKTVASWLKKAQEINQEIKEKTTLNISLPKDSFPLSISVGQTTILIHCLETQADIAEETTIDELRIGE